MKLKPETLEYATPARRELPINIGLWSTILFNVLTVVPGVILLFNALFNTDGWARIGYYFMGLILIGVQLMIGVFSIFIDTYRWRIPVASFVFAVANLMLILVLPGRGGC